jgi:hypothetical protein
MAGKIAALCEQVSVSEAEDREHYLPIYSRCMVKGAWISAKQVQEGDLYRRSRMS